MDQYVAKLHILLIAGGILAASIGLALAIHIQTPEAVDGGPISETALLIVYETDHCPACDTFREQAGRAYRKSDLQDKAPLIYRPIESARKPAPYRLKGPVNNGLTAVLFDRYGREVARFDAPVSNAPQLIGDVGRFIKRALR